MYIMASLHIKCQQVLIMANAINTVQLHHYRIPIKHLFLHLYISWEKINYKKTNNVTSKSTDISPETVEKM